MRDIDRELAELSRIVGSQRSVGALDPHREPGTESRRSSGLRNQVEGARSPVALAALRHSVADTVKSAGAHSRKSWSLME